jgi:hypothetical protein
VNRCHKGIPKQDAKQVEHMGSIKRQWEREREATVRTAFHAFREAHSIPVIDEAVIRAFMTSPYFDGRHSLAQLESILVGQDE